MESIRIERGFAEVHRKQAAALYYAAFRQKLQPIFRDETRGLALLEQALESPYCMAAFHEDQLVGIAGFKDRDASLVNIQPRMMVDQFGFAGGWARLLALSLFSRGLEDGTLLMDGIVVDPAMRGRGVGSRLLDAIIAYATTEGYGRVRLDVVDTNPRARQLYERMGFIPVRTEQFGWLKPLFGFGASTTMHRAV